MRSFLKELLRHAWQGCTVIVVDEEGVERPRRFRVVPARWAGLWAASLLGAFVLAVALLALTPLRDLVPGHPGSEIREEARTHALRVRALEDTLSMQRRYMGRIRSLITGQVDSTVVAEARPARGEGTARRTPVAAAPPRAEQPPAEDTPAAPARARSAELGARETADGPAVAPLNLRFPVLPPVNGFLTRGYDARTGHYAIDIAVQKGSAVHAIGDGYVILADWTQEGGHAIAVQHADGYVSVYMHNQRLLKRVGDRVRSREVIARSGNTGEVTTGPHVHVELWRDGIAQDPEQYFVGL